MLDNKYKVDDCAWIDNIIQEHKKSNSIHNIFFINNLNL